jgi:hypothetical protein
MLLIEVLNECFSCHVPVLSPLCLSSLIVHNEGGFKTRCFCTKKRIDGKNQTRLYQTFT